MDRAGSRNSRILPYGYDAKVERLSGRQLDACCLNQMGSRTPLNGVAPENSLRAIVEQR